MKIHDNRKYLLGIYPQYHSIMFSDSILHTEDRTILEDISYTNSIHKIYVCSISGVENLKYGDIVVVYRTAENNHTAEYSSVATSICCIEEVKLQQDFADFEHFYKYACQYSVFDRDDLLYWYNRGNCRAIKMTYNVALNKRITRHELIENVGLSRYSYYGFFELSDEQFESIAYLGKIDTNIFG